MGIDDNVFWKLTPKTIQVYFRAYEKRRKIAEQDMWLQGLYYRHARQEKYPEMPYANEIGNEAVQDERWAEVQRHRMLNKFMAILGKNK